MSGTEHDHREPVKGCFRCELSGIERPDVADVGRRNALILSNIRLRAAISQAIEELEYEHQPTVGAFGCTLCWPESGGWPCASRMVADDLRQALGGEE